MQELKRLRYASLLVHRSNHFNDIVHAVHSWCLACQPDPESVDLLLAEIGMQPIVHQHRGDVRLVICFQFRFTYLCVGGREWRLSGLGRCISLALLIKTCQHVMFNIYFGCDSLHYSKILIWKLSHVVSTIIAFCNYGVISYSR